MDSDETETNKQIIMQKLQKEIKYKHRVCGITRMTPNLSLPEREIAKRLPGGDRT